MSEDVAMRIFAVLDAEPAEEVAEQVREVAEEASTRLEPFSTAWRLN
jgi:hypothetical protein